MENEVENNGLPVGQEVAEAGRGGDTVMAHLSLGELVIPRAFLDDPRVMEAMRQLFDEAGVNINQYIVGDAANSINPETGYPEFGFFKSVSKILKKAANVVLPNLGIVGGFTNGLIQGQGLSGALKQGLTSGIQAGASIVGGPLAGAAAGAANSAINGRNPITGAITGGIGGALSGNNAFSGALADTAVGRGVDSLYRGSTLQDLYKTASGSVDRIGSGVSELYNGSDLQSAFKSGGDALKSIGIDTASSASAPVAGGGQSSYGPPAPPIQGPQLPNSGVPEVAKSTDYFSPIASALLGNRANSQAEDALLRQQEANQALLAPYTSGFSFDANNLQSDPGYQFNVQEGQQALDRAQLARGGFFSGGALKEAQTFGQGLADNTYNSAFNRALQGRQAGLTGALAGAGVNTDIGNIKANAATNQGNLLSGALGSILGGRSFTNTGALQGGFDLQEFLRRNGIGASSYAS